ncbi:MAG: hypothetical protein EBV23_10455 [Flavobacteriia bacterium]|nr:hypothetical protein [Flavobacteriia bacterium]
MPEAFKGMSPRDSAKAVYEVAKMVLPGGVSKAIDQTRKLYDTYQKTRPDNNKTRTEADARTIRRQVKKDPLDEE